jgi:prevent-host-death family protein
MRNYHLYGAGSVFSQLIDSAPTREPQRVTWRGKEAVVVASKVDWLARPKRSPNLVQACSKDNGRNRIGRRDRRSVVGDRQASIW